ncbi:hypothetical protein TL16_g00722 [Triparma laevis f. inornata]|uniref:Uncharacterized protein n=1 Tax=Triparma laevis f. inornata TaxID=1714386 RepID=A0A9W6ZDK0_9STRA|nr:hypothetical protein TL16_g00722 [Triparma laevis f. inornata]
MDNSLAKLLDDLDGFVKKREDGTSLTFKAIKEGEESANNAKHQMETALKMFDADPEDDMTGLDSDPSSPTQNNNSFLPSSQGPNHPSRLSPNTTANNTLSNKKKKNKNETPEVNWDKLFTTGNLNVDEHLEKLKAQKEKRKRLMDYAKINQPEKKKDPFRAYSARRTSINPIDDLTKVDKLLIQMKLSPSPSPSSSPRTLVGKSNRNNVTIMDKGVEKTVGDLVKDTAEIARMAAGLAREETRQKTPAGEKRRKGKGKVAPKPPPPSIASQKQQKQQELMDIILPSVLQRKKKKRPKKKTRPQHAANTSLLSRTSPNPSLVGPEVDDLEDSSASLFNDLMSKTDSLDTMSATTVGSAAVNQKRKKSKRLNRNNNGITDNPYNLNVRPGKFNVPSFTPVQKPLAPLSNNALRLLEMKKKKDQHISASKKAETADLIQRQADRMADIRTQREFRDKVYQPPKFGSAEEAKIHYERKQLERQGLELLEPMKQKKLMKLEFNSNFTRQEGRRKQNQKKKQQQQLSPIGLKESNELLNCMDDLLLQIAILTSRLIKLQEVEVVEEVREENVELLDCLNVVGTHINKHKEVMEGSEKRGSPNRSHVSILKSAQTLRLTLLSIIDTLNKRKEEEGWTKNNLGLLAALEPEIPVVVSDPVNPSSSSPSPKKFSHLDGISDDRVRQRLLLKIAED